MKFYRLKCIKDNSYKISKFKKKSEKFLTFEIIIRAKIKQKKLFNDDSADVCMLGAQMSSGMPAPLKGGGKRRIAPMTYVKNVLTFEKASWCIPHIAIESIPRKHLQVTCSSLSMTYM